MRHRKNKTKKKNAMTIMKLYFLNLRYEEEEGVNYVSADGILDRSMHNNVTI